jgi:hypothetical protein
MTWQSSIAPSSLVDTRFAKSVKFVIASAVFGTKYVTLVAARTCVTIGA